MRINYVSSNSAVRNVGADPLLLTHSLVPSIGPGWSPLFINYRSTMKRNGLSLEPSASLVWFMGKSEVCSGTRLSELQSEILSVSFLWNFPYWGWCHFQRTNVLLAYYICYQTSFHLKHWEKMCFHSCRDVVLGEKFHAIEVQQTAVIWFRSNSLGQRHF